MNKTISSRWAIGLLITIVVVISAYLWFENASFQNENLSTAPKAQALQNTLKTTCKNHAFQGNTIIKVWPIKKGAPTILKIDPTDIAKMPSAKITEIKLIDPSPQLVKTLASTSSKNPVKINLTGVAIPCNGTALACLNYKDGIFRPYL